jgi:ABC-type transport system involved in multi-copper enzyme maturation permease subunit
MSDLTDLTRITRAELAKLARRPAAWVLLATAVVLDLVFAYVIPYVSYRSGSGGELTDGLPPAQLLATMLPDQVVTNTTAAFPVFTGALALVLGALASGSEYAGGTLKTLLTQGPRRLSVFGGQALAVVTATGVGVLGIFAAASASSAGVAVVEGADLTWPDPTDLVTGLASGWAVLGMWALLGLALGVVLRGVAMPIGLGVVWILGIENFVGALARTTLTALQPVRDLLPGANSGSLLLSVLPSRVGDMPPGVQSVVSGGRGLVTVLAYAVLSLALVLLVGRRRDVAA